MLLFRSSLAILGKQGGHNLPPKHSLNNANNLIRNHDNTAQIVSEWNMVNLWSYPNPSEIFHLWGLLNDIAPKKV
jgi:hypothetical protein